MVKSLILLIDNKNIVQLSKKFFEDFTDLVDIRKCSETFGLKKGYQTSPGIVLSDGFHDGYTNRSSTWIHIQLVKGMGKKLKFLSKGSEIVSKDANLELDGNNLILSFGKTDKEKKFEDINKFLGGKPKKCIILLVLKDGFDRKVVDEFIENNKIDDRFEKFEPLEYVYLTDDGERRHNLL